MLWSTAVTVYLNHKQIIKMQARYFGLETESSALAHLHSIPLPVLGGEGESEMQGSSAVRSRNYFRALGTGMNARHAEFFPS